MYRIVNQVNRTSALVLLVYLIIGMASLAWGKENGYVDIQKILNNADNAADDHLIQLQTKLWDEINSIEAPAKKLKVEIERIGELLSDKALAEMKAKYKQEKDKSEPLLENTAAKLHSLQKEMQRSIINKIMITLKDFGKYNNFERICAYKVDSLTICNNNDDFIYLDNNAAKSSINKTSARDLTDIVIRKINNKKDYIANSTDKMFADSESSSGFPDKSAPSITITYPEVKRGLKVTAKSASITVTGIATGASGIAEVIINGQSSILDENGNFSAPEVLLKVGDNRITVTALGVNKQRTTETFIIAREGGVLSQTKQNETNKAAYSPLAKGKSYALIVGINDYHNIDQLKTASNDATTVAQVLRDNYGFDTMVITDAAATRTKIMKELNSLKNQVNPEDRLLIYYAGHGYNDNETETSYWLPVESEKNDPTNWINAKDVTDQLKRSKAKQVLIVADSCYSGTISRAIDPSLTGRGTRDTYIYKMMEKPSRVLISSGGNEPVSDAGGKGHSIFAQVFIDALQNPKEQIFTAEELLTHQIKESVAGRANQTPEYKVIRNSGHDGGDFVFEVKQGDKR